MIFLSNLSIFYCICQGTKERITVPSKKWLLDHFYEALCSGHRASQKWSQSQFFEDTVANHAQTSPNRARCRSKRISRSSPKINDFRSPCYREFYLTVIWRLAGGFFLGWNLCKNRFLLPKMARSAANPQTQLRPGPIIPHNENPSLVALGN